MIPGIYINCALYPFIQWIIAGKKLYETRNRNTLQNFIGKTIYLVQTGKGKPLIMATATIDSVIMVDNKETYESYRPYTCIEHGSMYDFGYRSFRKYLYKLSNVQPFKEPIPVPNNAKRHGYTWIEIELVNA